MKAINPLKAWLAPIAGVAILSLSFGLGSLASQPARAAGAPGTTSLNHVLALLGVDSAAFERLPKLPDAVKFPNSQTLSNTSRIIKIQLDPVIKKLLLEENYGMLPVFEPSSTMSRAEADEKMKAYRLRICNDTLGKEGMAHVLKEFSQLVGKDLDLPKESLPKDTADAVASVLSLNDKNELGRPVGLTTINGYVAGIRFEKADITLSILMTYISGQDRGFIHALGCILDETQARTAETRAQLEGFNKAHSGLVEGVKNLWPSRGTEIKAERTALSVELDRRARLEAFVREKYGQAGKVHAALHSLNYGQLKTLFALLARENWDLLAGGDAFEITRKRLMENRDSAIAMKSSERLVNTYVSALSYVDLTYRQLGELETALVARKETRKQTESVIQEIKR